MDFHPNLQSILDKQRKSFIEEGPAGYSTRLAHINIILEITEKHGDAIAAAISRDFGNRSVHETKLSDLMMVISGAKHARRHLRKWMKMRKVPTGLPSLPGRSRILPQPLGVVGIISPWNYPYVFMMLPALSALAAGNRVMDKPSEITARTTELMGNLVADKFREEVFTLIPGDDKVGRAFSSLPFDHLLFTGSTTVGREIAKAAAENLTPVTLELGGKSPAIIDEGYSPEKALDPILRGKMFNSGQTCIGVDYLFIQEERLEKFVAGIQTRAKEFFPAIKNNPDFTSIVSKDKYHRLLGLIADAEKKGARIIQINPAKEELPAESRKIPLTLILNPSDRMKVMQEEIFGPLLPIKTYRRLEEVIDYLNSHPRPLSLYWFGHDSGNRRRFMERTWAGGVSVNETLYHIIQEHLPFGGVGNSGMGTHMGEAGFRTFSNHKSIFIQSRLNLAHLLNPPYGKLADRMLALIKRLV